MKKKEKLLKILVITTILVLMSIMLNIFDNYTYAFNTEDYTQIYTPNNGGLLEKGGQILWIAQMIGYAVSIIMLVIIGIQYVTKSPDEKAKVKDRLIIYATGAVILFAATTLVSLVANFGSGLFK